LFDCSPTVEERLKIKKNAPRNAPPSDNARQTKLRAGLVPASRSDLYARLERLIVHDCPFANLPEERQMGTGPDRRKDQAMYLGKPEFVANFEFL
jgi:hypothetical protein